MTLLTEAPVPDLYTLEVVTSRLAEPRTMTVTAYYAAQGQAGPVVCEPLSRNTFDRVSCLSISTQ
jgi:hypothetical protein